MCSVKIYVIIGLAIFGTTIETSCKKFVSIDAPTTQLVSKTVFENNATAVAAQTAIYSQMENSRIPYFIPLFAGLSADELLSYSNDVDLTQVYQNSISPGNTLVSGNLWTSMYSYIYQANAVLEGLEKSTAISYDVKTQLMGEAKFIRAFWYFYLLNLYGDVPMLTTTDYKLNAIAPTVSKSEGYNQIVADLIEAKTLLSKNFVGADCVTSTVDRVRPTKWAASALLARVYLFLGDYSNAELESTAVIEDGVTFSIVGSLNDVFLKNSAEAIWQIMIPQPSGVNTVEGQNFILSEAPLSNNYNSSTISNLLMRAFENNDNRRISWIDSNVVGLDTFYFPFKYKVKEGSQVSEYSMVLRLSEQYLIRAEARVQRGNSVGAVQDLNVIRVRAGLPNVSSAGQVDILTAILHERQSELFTEWGHRWMDLKRLNIIDDVMNGVAAEKGTVWDSNKQLYPIPQTERNKNPNLAQNIGY